MNQPNVPIAAWSLRTWPPLWWQANRCDVLQLIHHQTTITSVDERLGRCAGQTIWCTRSDVGDAGVAWDWVQMPRGMVAMVDPMCVATNLRLLGDTGEVLTAFESARILNSIVYMLPWQREVRRALGDSLH
jgi:hypothetical protein